MDKEEKLSTKYLKEIRPKLQKEFGLANFLAAPRLKKVVVSMGVKEGAKDKGIIEKAKGQLAAITGQAPKICRAKKSIAAFNLAVASPIGLAVTLRGEKMFNFLEKLVGIVLPRTRDFHGVPLTGFDKNNNYSLGIREMVIFPEVDYTQLDKNRGLEVTFVLESADQIQSRRLLEELGMPFVKNN